MLDLMCHVKTYLFDVGGDENKVDTAKAELGYAKESVYGPPHGNRKLLRFLGTIFETKFYSFCEIWQASDVRGFQHLF